MMKAPPENLARFLDMLGERESVGLYGWAVLDATLRSYPGQWFPLEPMTGAQFRQLERRVKAMDGYPFRHEAEQVGEGRTPMVRVRVVEDDGRKPAPAYDDTAQPWEVDPVRHFDPDERAAALDEARSKAAWHALGDDDRDDLPVEGGHLL